MEVEKWKRHFQPMVEGNFLEKFDRTIKDTGSFRRYIRKVHELRVGNKTSHTHGSGHRDSQNHTETRDLAPKPLAKRLNIAKKKPTSRTRDFSIRPP